MKLPKIASLLNPINLIQKMNDLIDVARSPLKRSTEYALGDIVFPYGLPSYLYLECTQAGTTSFYDLVLSTVENAELTDGTVQWKVRRIPSKWDIDKIDLLNMIHPVGCIYTTLSDENPAITFGGGEWERIGQGRCLIDAGSNYAVGSMGGSADAIVPYHTHTFTGSAVNSGNQSAGHTHGFTTGNVSQGHTHTTTTGNPNANHQHYIANNSTTNSATGGVSVNSSQYIYAHAFTSGWGESYTLKGGAGAANVGLTSTVTAWHTHTGTSGGISANHTHSGTTGGISANHTHSVTAAGSNSYAGTNGNTAGANMPPYLAVYMWKRVA